MHAAEKAVGKAALSKGPGTRSHPTSYTSVPRTLRVGTDRGNEMSDIQTPTL